MKSLLRAAALRQRATLAPPDFTATALSALPQHTPIAAFWPLPHEPDLRPLLHALHARNQPVLLPQTAHPLVFRPWTPTTAMVPDRFGTHRPDTPPATPGFILVPCLAFDRTGGRLGYGGGYYDRTLAALPHTPRAGICHAALELPHVPMQDHDVRLPVIITENEVIEALLF